MVEKVGGGGRLMHKQDPFLSVSLPFIDSVCHFTTLHTHAVCNALLCAERGNEGKGEQKWEGGLALPPCYTFKGE